MTASSRLRAETADAESPSDDDLVLAVAGGDRHAFGVLIERHLERTVRVAWRLLGDRSDAEDVAHDAFLRVWKAARRWKPGRARFTTWLYRVTTNLCIDLRRKPRHGALDDAAEPMDPAPNPADALERRRRDAAVAGAVAELPRRQREAVALIYGGGLSNKEAAEALQISVKALESLLVRARRALRGVLREMA